MVTRCNSVARWCVFNSFWTTMRLFGTEEEDKIRLCIHSHYFLGSLHCCFWFFLVISWQKKNIFTFTWTFSYSLGSLLSSVFWLRLCNAGKDSVISIIICKAFAKLLISHRELWINIDGEWLQFTDGIKEGLTSLSVSRLSAAKSYRGPSGAPGRCHPRTAEPRGGAVDGYGQRARGHAQPHRGGTYAQRRHERSEQRVRDGTAVGQQTLPHGRSWEHVDTLESWVLGWWCVWGAAQ